MVNAFYVADLAQRGQQERAQVFLNGIHRANASEMEGASWAFPEYVHGKPWAPGGTRHQGWSAAGAIIAERALAGAHLLRIEDGGSRQ